MKLIDADLFLEEISKGATVEDLKKLVTECKGVPVTGIVRCKDCRYAEHRVQMPDQIYCHVDSFSPYHPVHSFDDFCNYGERREP